MPLLQYLPGVAGAVRQSVDGEEGAVARQEEDGAPPGTGEQSRAKGGGAEVGGEDGDEEAEDAAGRGAAGLGRVARGRPGQVGQGPEEAEEGVPAEEDEEVEGVRLDDGRYE